MAKEELYELRGRTTGALIGAISIGCNYDLLVRWVADVEEIKPSIVKYVLDKLIDADLVFVDDQNMAYVCEFDPHRFATFLARKHFESNKQNRYRKSLENKTRRWNEYWANKVEL